MIDKRLFLAPALMMAPLALLAACSDDAPADDGRSASGEVLEGSISDAMLPVDRVRSQPPLEDPEAFAEAVEGEESDAESGEEGEEAAEGEADAAEGAEAEPAAEEPEAAADEG